MLCRTSPVLFGGTDLCMFLVSGSIVLTCKIVAGVKS